MHLIYSYEENFAFCWACTRPSFDWQVTDIWCDHLTKLVHVVVCGQIVPDIEPYKRDKRKDVIENQCLG